jgi:hypothetical protein
VVLQAFVQKGFFDHVLAIVKHAVNLKRFDVLPERC